MYDDKGRMLIVPLDAEEKIRYAQQGEKEELLCASCEQHINDFEKHVNRVFFHKFAYEPTEQPGEGLIVELDYTKFKLFQLSVLWRASVSTLPTYAQVNLGPHEEQIRQMIINRTPGPPHQYGCVVTGLETGTDIPFDLILQPRRGRWDGHVAYRFVFGHCIWIYVISSHSRTHSRADYFVRKDGTMRFRIMHLKDVGFIVDELKRVSQRDDLP